MPGQDARLLGAPSWSRVTALPAAGPHTCPEVLWVSGNASLGGGVGPPNGSTSFLCQRLKCPREPMSKGTFVPSSHWPWSEVFEASTMYIHNSQRAWTMSRHTWQLPQCPAAWRGGGYPQNPMPRISQEVLKCCRPSSCHKSLPHGRLASSPPPLREPGVPKPWTLLTDCRGPVGWRCLASWYWWSVVYGPQAMGWYSSGCISQPSLRGPGLCPDSATSFLGILRRDIISQA